MYYLQKQYNIHRQRDIYPNKNNIVNQGRDDIIQVGLALQVLQWIVYVQMLQGVVLGFLRSREPVFKSMIFKEVWAWFGISTDMDV